MPGMSGLELLPKAKALRPDVPIIMITAYGDAETKRKALENGAEALLTKPIDFGTLRSEIDMRIERAVPGNSGGPLLSDLGNLIGVNSFKAGGEGLNFAVSVDEVRKFITRSGNRLGQTPSATKGDRGCKPKQLSKFRYEQNDATVVSFDMFLSLIHI